MSPEQINIAIAKYCGLPIDICRCGDGPDAQIHSVACEYAHMFSPMADTPDYYHELNAMHEAEEILIADGDHSAAFSGILREICLTEWMAGKREYPRVIYATAAQRAEAFLRTVGKWEGGEE